MTHPTEQDRERARALCEMSNTMGPSAWEAGCAQGIASERARIVEWLREVKGPANVAVAKVIRREAEGLEVLQQLADALESEAP